MCNIRRREYCLLCVARLATIMLMEFPGVTMSSHQTQQGGLRMMQKALWISLGLLLLAAIGAPNAHADTAVLINFETVPAEPAGPSVYSECTAATITVPDVASISGGCILGDANFFPALGFATPPNVYGTAGFGTTPSSTLTINISPSFTADEVSFPL